MHVAAQEFDGAIDISLRHFIDEFSGNFVHGHGFLGAFKLILKRLSLMKQIIDVSLLPYRSSRLKVLQEGLWVLRCAMVSVAGSAGITMHLSLIHI